MDARLAGKILCIIEDSARILRDKLLATPTPMDTTSRQSFSRKSHKLLDALEQVIETFRLSEIPAQLRYVHVQKGVYMHKEIPAGDLAESCLSILNDCVKLLGIERDLALES